MPLLIKRTVWETLVVPTVCAGNVSLFGVKSNDPPENTPAPETVIACVTKVPAASALSVMMISSICTPTEVGAKIICMVQVPPPPATEVPQVLVWVKSPLPAMLVMVSAVLLSLVKVTVIGLLEVSSN